MAKNAIKKGNTVKIISGSKKGVTGKVVQVLPKKQAVRIEGIGQIHRVIKPSMQNPRGGHKDIHVPVSLSKVMLVEDKPVKVEKIKAKKENK